MGVPKFFRYISERYPCLSELVRENQIPEFDNLYLDMNGIIHVCSHPNDNDPHFRISEANIFKDIAHYIEVLFRMIQPQKLFFMAVDGVAPRAKMNQQRGRRFRSAREAQDLEDAAKAKGEELPKEARFDSNCITPGTAFMARLQEYLKQFVRHKMNTDSNWQKCRVILSGHETPGEGEHKIMEYIRYLKASPGYDCNTRHCLYGLDADLIMLGLCSHEPHFSLLREEVKFGKQANNRQPTAEETRFYLLHLTLLRDYLEQEFYSVQKTLPFPYNLECIIDDWIFMGFLVGNDFIPHLPNLHINSNALPLLYDVYKEVLPTLDGYINEAGNLNLNRLEKFIEKLAMFDRAHFSDANADLKYFAAKCSDNAWLPEHKKSDQPENKPKSKELLDLVNAVEDMFLEDESPSTESEDLLHSDIREKNILNMTDEEILEEEFNIHKKDYYINKLGYTSVTPAVLAEQAECYIRALQWTLMYYYKGVCSWGWFYPHHYAPFISDIRDFKHLDYTFNLGKPFLPFQQLLAVLPAASGALLPDAFRKLMVSPESPILQYYPTTFETDLNGKKQEWEAVVLIPFIEEELLLKAMSQQEHLLSSEEVSRNIHGPMLQYDYLVTSSVPDLTLDIPDPPKDFVQETRVNRSELYVPQDKLILGPMPGAKFDVYFPGFPTMKHLEYSSKLEKSIVRVFEQITRNDSMIIELDNKTNLLQAGEVAKHVLGKSIFVQWPHLVESKVLCVVDDKYRYKLNDKNEVCKEAHTDVSLNEFKSLKKSNFKHYYERLGIDISDTYIMVQVLQLKNRVYVFGKQGRITLEKEWGSIPSYHPMQTCVCDLKVHNSQFVQYDTVEEVFTKFKQVYLLSRPYYGGRGIVYETEKTGRLKIGVFTTEDPNFMKAKQMHTDDMNAYFNGYDAAAQIGISSYLLGRVTGTIYIMPGSKSSDTPAPQNSFSKYNIGLNLKFTKKNEEVTGFSHRIGNTWYYSAEAIRLLRDYTYSFPEVFHALNQGNYNDTYYESDLFPNDVGTGRLESILDWLKKQSHYDAMRKSCDSEAMTKDVVQEIMTAISYPLKTSKIVIALKPIHVFVPGLQPCGRAPDPQAVFKLFDRVVNVRPNHTVPLGAKGTVIGIHKSRDPNPIHQTVTEDIFLDVVFDEQFEGGTKYAGVANGHCYRMNPTALINLTFGNETGAKVLVQTKSSQWNTNIENSPNAANFPPQQRNSGQSSDDRFNKSNKNSCMNMSFNSSLTQQTPPRNLVVANSQRQEVKNASPAERKQFWDDLVKQKNVASPSTDTGTEALKQILGVTKTAEPTTVLQNLPLRPEKSFQMGAVCPNPTPINVQDMFKHARATTSGAPNLPPPPMQWYGPPNPNNIATTIQRVEPVVQNHGTPNASNILMSGLIPPVVPAPQVVNRPPPQVVNRPPPQVVNRPPPQVVHQPPPQVVHQPPPQVVHQLPPQVVHQPPPQVVHQQSPQVVHQPAPQVVHQPAPQAVNQPPLQIVHQPAPQVINQPAPIIRNVPIVNQQVVEKNVNKIPTAVVDNTPPSAFIPLQAVKKGRLRNNSQTQLQDPDKPPTKEELEDQVKSDVNQKRQEIETKQVESQQNFQKFLMSDPVSESEQNKSLVEKPIPKKVRKSRIAANFGTPIL